MNELEKTLQTLLEKAIAVAEQSGNFAIEQAPLLLQEFYAWHLVSNIIFIVIAVLFIFIGHKVFMTFGTSEKKGGYYDSFQYKGKFFQSNEGVIAVVIMGGATSIALVITSLIKISDIIKIIIAPKLYLIEYFIN